MVNNVTLKSVFISQLQHHLIKIFSLMSKDKIVQAFDSVVNPELLYDLGERWVNKVQWGFRIWGMSEAVISKTVLKIADIHGVSIRQILRSWGERLRDSLEGQNAVVTNRVHVTWTSTVLIQPKRNLETVKTKYLF